ncbi:MAG: DUF1844 domain-containing protein [Kiritimatiellae bacterium]|nr:DUF1844 domain-containing protein [Kiritimatiellia bacterium]
MNESKSDINKMLFMHLVSMLAMSAIQQMGKLVDPATGKAETNLDAAQATIDMLDMLELKTRGNLDAEETKLIKDTLMSLKMNYVESQDLKTDARRQTTDDRPEKAEAGGQTPDAGHQTAEKKGQKEESGQKSASADDGKTPKYHKKYE